MVIKTLNALARLDYPNFEVLVVDNNTQDESVWKPLEEHCASLGTRFRFFHLPKWPGFKAGALNFALQQTAEEAEIIGVIDSDYIVTPDWLRATLPYFDKPEVAFVQAPQDYRDADENYFKRMCYWEYAGFFHIGMVQRNERNAIIQHGTMTLIRAVTLRNVKGRTWLASI
jgi:cellulose synthase/poly-beta-1,6-N-acetylglucosamine synthase-like glycosyltransferase